MYIEDRLYSEYNDEVYYSVTLTEDELRLYSEFQEKLYGTASAVGGVLSAGGWNAKELAKLQAKDKDDYENHKYREYLKGVLAPAAASYKLHKAQELAKKGASPEEIKKKTKLKGGQVAAEFFLNPFKPLTSTAARVKQLHTKIDEDNKGMRRKFKKD